MSHRSVDGTLVVAQLKRGLLGAAVYKDVTVREPDGAHRKLGTLMVLDDMRHVMVPGRSGRFYLYDVLGSKGVHGFRPAAGPAHAYFPYRWEVMTWGVGALNLLMALTWLLMDGSFAIWTTGFGILGVVLGIMFLTTRISAMKAYRADDARVPGSSVPHAARA
jgi:hypothetical protein